MIDNEKIKFSKPILRIRDVYPGSWIRLFSIPDPGSRTRIRIFSIPDPGSTSKNLIILSSQKYDPGCSSRILTFYPSWIPDPGVKKAPDPGTSSATLLQTMTTLNSQAFTLARRQEKVGESTAPSMEGSISPTTSKLFMLSTLNTMR
jgi:hypothetical protein